MNLLDDGIAADVKKNDGIYSRHFTAFTAVGRYSITIKASDPDGTAVVRMFEYGEGDYGKSDEYAHDPNAGGMEEILVLPPQKPSKITLSNKSLHETRLLERGCTHTRTLGDPNPH